MQFWDSGLEVGLGLVKSPTSVVGIKSVGVVVSTVVNSGSGVVTSGSGVVPSESGVVISDSVVCSVVCCSVVPSVVGFESDVVSGTDESVVVSVASVVLKSEVVVSGLLTSGISVVSCGSVVDAGSGSVVNGGSSVSLVVVDSDEASVVTSGGIVSVVPSVVSVLSVVVTSTEVVVSYKMEMNKHEAK